MLGPGGVGKTRLALELAASHGRLAGFVELDTVDDGTGVLPAVAVSLDLRTAAPDGLLESCVDRLGAATGARAAWRQGARDDVERLSRAGLEVAVRSEDRRACLDALASAALAIGYGGDPERAIELARRAVTRSHQAHS